MLQTSGVFCFNDMQLLITAQGIHQNSTSSSLFYFQVVHGYSCIFSLYLQVLDESKLQQVDSLHKEFETPEKANKV